MKNHTPIAAAVIAALLTAGLATSGLTQPAAKPARARAAPRTAATGAYQSQNFAPGLDDLMTMLVQPRHIKLYYAGTAGNWELAAAESRDLRASFGRLAETIATYEGNDVNKATATFIVPQMDALDAAIAAADAKKFAGAYDDLTKGCNQCHTYMEHPFDVIKIPDAANAAYSDQDFKPGP